MSKKRSGNSKLSRRAICVLLVVLIAVIICIPKRPDVQFKTVNDIDIQFGPGSTLFDPRIEGIIVTMTLDVYNYNIYSSRIRYLDVDVYLNDEFIGVVEDEMDQILEPLEHNMVVVDFDLQIIPLGSIFEETKIVRIVGHARVVTFGIEMDVDIDEERAYESD